MVSNFPSEMKFNIENIRNIDAQVKQTIENSRREAVSYLNRICDTSNKQDHVVDEDVSLKLYNMLKQELNSKHKANLLLETHDNEAKIALLNYYKEHNNALQKIEKEVAEVKQAMEALEVGNKKLNIIYSNISKRSTNYAGRYKHQTNMDRLSSLPEIRSNELDAPTFNAFSFKRRNNTYIKNIDNLKNIRDIPGSKEETLYCICRRVSYGDMVGCDNENCEIEWFHYKCVGLNSSPKGTWYCDQCLEKMRAAKT